MMDLKQTSGADLAKQMESTEQKVERPDGGLNYVSNVYSKIDRFYDVVRLSILKNNDKKEGQKHILFAGAIIDATDPNSLKEVDFWLCKTREELVIAATTSSKIHDWLESPNITNIKIWSVEINLGIGSDYESIIHSKPLRDICKKDLFSAFT